MKLLTLYVAGGAMLVVGLIDDLTALRPHSKLLLQMIVIVGLVLAGFRVESVTHPLTGAPIQLGWLGQPRLRQHGPVRVTGWFWGGSRGQATRSGEGNRLVLGPYQTTWHPRF